MHELGLIDAIDYMTGISGGGWAVSVYSYAQSRVSDTVLLGPVVPPADITYNLLGLMDPNCVRGRTNGNGEAALEADPGPTLYASWLNMISNYYLKPR